MYARVLRCDVTGMNVLHPLFSATTSYGHRSETCQEENFEFNVLPSVTSSFGATSDIVIVFMTLNRFQLVHVSCTYVSCL